MLYPFAAYHTQQTVQLIPHRNECHQTKRVSIRATSNLFRPPRFRAVVLAEMRMFRETVILEDRPQAGTESR